MRKLLLLAALCAALSTPARAALSTTNSVITYTSNGATTAFATTYRFLNTSHLVVTKTDLSAVTTTLTLGTDYSVTGANAAAGGTVTLVSAIPVNWTLKIKRSTPKTQACNFRSQGAFQTKTFEDCLDIIEMQIQEMNDGTFTQLLATPVTTAQASTAAPIAIPNAANTNDVGTSASFAKADHVHQLAVGPMLSASTAAGQSIPSGAATIVVFGTVGRDTDSAYNNATGRYTVPAGKGGDYLISSSVSWNAAPGNQPVIAIYKNAAQHLATVPGALTPGGASGMFISTPVNLAAGDIVDIRVSQTTGGAVTLAVNAAINFFTLKRIQ